MQNQTDKNRGKRPVARAKERRGTMYDRIAEARARRERVLSGSPPDPIETDSKETIASLRGQDAAPPSPAPDPSTKRGIMAPSVVDDPAWTEDEPEEYFSEEISLPKGSPRRGTGLWLVSLTIAAFAVGSVVWLSRPASEMAPTIATAPPEGAGDMLAPDGALAGEATLERTEIAELTTPPEAQEEVSEERPPVPDSAPAAIALADLTPVESPEPQASKAANTPPELPPVTALTVMASEIPQLPVSDRPDLSTRPWAAFRPGDSPRRLASLDQTVSLPVFGPAPLPIPRADVSRPQPRPTRVAETATAETLPDPEPTRISALTDRDLRVVLNAPRTVPDASLSAIIDALEKSGADPDPRRVNITISTSNVRYYHDTDADVALAIAEGIGAQVRDFTNFEPTPPEGLVEIWIAGRAIATNDDRQVTLVDQIAEDLRLLQTNLTRVLRGN